MDHVEGVNNIKETATDSQGKNVEKTVDEERNTFCSGMQQSGKTESEKNTKNSDTLSEGEPKEGSFNHKSDCMNVLSRESPELSKKTTEFERIFLHHRGNEDFFASDEESAESNRSVSSNESSRGASARKSEYLMNNYSFCEHLNSIPGFYDCDEKISNLLALNELLRYRNDEINVQGTYEDITSQLNQVILNVESSKSSSSSEKESEKLRISPERANVSDYDSSQGNKQSVFTIQKSNSSGHQPSDCISQISELPTKMEVISQYPNDSSHLINSESSEWKSSRTSDLGVYGMITTPISSSYINLESTESLQSSYKSNTFHKTKMEVPSLNSSAISVGRLSQRSLSPTAEAVKSPNSKIFKVKFSRSFELPSSSNNNTHSKKEWQQSNAYSSSSIHIKNKESSSLTDLPNLSSKIRKPVSPRFPQNRRMHKSSRLLNFNDSDTSSDDAKGNFPIKKESQKRRKIFPNHLSNPRENHSIFLKKDNEDVSENAHFSASPSQNYHKKSSNLQGNESANHVLRSLEIINSENFESYSSSRKRLVSNNKTSDSEQSSGESKTNKKLKLIIQ